MPSLADSCPNTVLEALLNGVPVIGSKAGGIPEILNFDEALFDVSATDLVKKIELLLSAPLYIEELKSLESKRKEELTFNWAEKIAAII